MPVGVVGLAAGPAGPDHAEPGAGDDAGGVWVGFAAGAGVGVEAGGPGRLHASVVGEGGQGLAGSSVGGPAELDPAGLAGGSGYRRRAAFGGGLLGAGDPVKDRPDLGQQLGQVDGADTGQGGQQLGAWMEDDAGGDRRFEFGDGPKQGSQQLDLGADTGRQGGGRDGDWSGRRGVKPG